MFVPPWDVIKWMCLEVLRRIVLLAAAPRTRAILGLMHWHPPMMLHKLIDLSSARRLRLN